MRRKKNKKVQMGNNNNVFSNFGTIALAVALSMLHYLLVVSYRTAYTSLSLGGTYYASQFGYVYTILPESDCCSPKSPESNREISQLSPMMCCLSLPKLFLFFRLSFFFLLLLILRLSRADIGTTTYYNPPYVLTAYYNSDESAFSANKLFAVASNGIWDKGAACGREYSVRCLSGPLWWACQVGVRIQVTVVYYMQTSASRPSKPGSTMALSVNAFAMMEREQDEGEEEGGERGEGCVRVWRKKVGRFLNFFSLFVHSRFKEGRGVGCKYSCPMI